MRGWTKLVALGAGLLAAALPVVASAAEEGGRTLERGDDWLMVLLISIGAMAAVMLIWTLGYLYRMRRNMYWDFQAPAAPHDDSGHH